MRVLEFEETWEQIQAIPREPGTFWEGIQEGDFVISSDGEIRVLIGDQLTKGWRILSDERQESSLVAHGFRFVYWHEQFPGDERIPSPHPEASNLLMGGAWRWVV